MSLGSALTPIGLFESLLTSQTSSATTTSSSKNAAGVLSSTSPFSNLNLSPTEQTQIAAILKSSQGQSFAQIANTISGVLTPTQKQTFASDLLSLQGQQGHHHHHGSRGSGSASTLDSGTDGFGVSSASSSASTATAGGSLFSDLAAQFSAQSQTQQASQLFNL